MDGEVITMPRVNVYLSKEEHEEWLKIPKGQRSELVSMTLSTIGSTNGNLRGSSIGQISGAGESDSEKAARLWKRKHPEHPVSARVGDSDKDSREDSQVEQSDADTKSA